MLEFNVENYETLIREGVTILDYYGDTCLPCKMLDLFIKKIPKDYPQVKIIKVNVDKHSEFVQSRNILGIPVLEFYCNGQLIVTEVGLVGYNTIKKAIEACINGTI